MDEIIDFTDYIHNKILDEKEQSIIDTLNFIEHYINETECSIDELLYIISIWKNTELK